MSNSTAVQIHCPYCNAVQAAQSDGSYSCDSCLQPFSIVQAQNEESRLLEEIRGWLDKRIGSAGLSQGGVDASSRSYIFQNRLLPDLRREVDRSLEALGSYGQFQLVPLPLPTAQAPGNGFNPLVTSRREILGLKNLRARLQSEFIHSFAVGADDQAAVQSLDRRLAEIMGLSNVAEAANRRDQIGYATARRNLELVLAEIGESLTVETSSDPTFRPYLAAQQHRYRSLVELCRLCEEISAANAVSGVALGQRADQLAADLRQSAREIEASGHSPVDAMPVVISTNADAAAADSLARWLRSYDALNGRPQQPFRQFVAEISAVIRSAQSAESATELVEGCAWLVRACRGELTVPFFEDHTWVPAWAEAARAKKSLGLFGNEETVVRLDQFLLPVWVADVSFSKAIGTVFKEGVEDRCVAVVDATAPTPAKVHFILDRTSTLAQALEQPRVLSSRNLALPASTAGAALLAVKQACSRRPEMLQAQVRTRGLAFLPAACAHYDSKQGARSLAACTGSQVPVDSSVVTSIQAANAVLRQFA